MGIPLIVLFLAVWHGAVSSADSESPYQRHQSIDLPSYEALMDEKRARGFLPLRGRKSEYDLLPEDFLEEDKRASGFVPLRGKKEDMEEDKRAFHALRGKKDFDLEDFEKHGAYRSLGGYAGGDPAEGMKRAFHALRGKKSSEAFEDGYSHKRSSGFFPLRGKREVTPLTSKLVTSGAERKKRELGGISLPKLTE